MLLNGTKIFQLQSGVCNLLNETIALINALNFIDEKTRNFQINKNNKLFLSDDNYNPKRILKLFLICPRMTSSGRFLTFAIAATPRGTVEGSFLTPLSGPMYGQSRDQ